MCWILHEEGEKQYSTSTIVLIAALNEEEGIRHTLAELKKNVERAEFIVVDGNSSDQTVRIAEGLGAEVLHQEGRGKGDAINFALQNINNDFDYAVLTD